MVRAAKGHKAPEWEEIAAVGCAVQVGWDVGMWDGMEGGMGGGMGDGMGWDQKGLHNDDHHGCTGKH